MTADDLLTVVYRLDDDDNAVLLHVEGMHGEI